MNEMSQNLVQVNLALEDVKLLLISLHNLQEQLTNPTTRLEALRHIQFAESFFGFDYEVGLILNDLPRFIDVVMAQVFDNLFDALNERSLNDGSIGEGNHGQRLYCIREIQAFLAFDSEKQEA